MALLTVVCVNGIGMLEKGKNYDVVGFRKIAREDYYILDGVKGVFNSSNFEEVRSVYLAVSNKLPEEGKEFTDFCRLVNGEWETVENSTPVRKMRHLGNNIYEVKTQDAIYMLQCLI